MADSTASIALKIAGDFVSRNMGHIDKQFVIDFLGLDIPLEEYCPVDHGSQFAAKYIKAISDNILKEVGG